MEKQKFRFSPKLQIANLYTRAKPYVRSWQIFTQNFQLRQISVVDWQNKLNLKTLLVDLTQSVFIELVLV